MAITAEIVGHSLSPQGDELISVLCTFPRIILAEVNTHRMLSKNTSSSRAIPFKKMVESVQNDPFVPIAWQKEHKGMQGSEYFTEEKEITANITMWLHAKDSAVQEAQAASRNFGITKQLCNRLLEPFMWTTMLITGPRSGWDNFFHLRCPSYEVPYPKEVKKYKSKKEVRKENHNLTINYTDLNWLELNKGQAEIHIMDLAEKIYEALNESTPKQLKAGEWHIPFKDKIISNNDLLYTDEIVKISTAMAARTSYTVVGEEKGIDYNKMIELHDRLLTQDPPHSSPMEHCAKAMTHLEHDSFFKGKLDHIEVDDFENMQIEEPLFSEKGWCRNFKGFIPYRYLVEETKEN